jgi:exodeoxyribonuclease VII large subunit
VLARRLAAARADLRAVEVRLHRAHPHRRIAEQRHALAAMRHRLETAMQPALVRRRHAIEAARGKLEALSPMRVLERGFSLTQRADGHVVTSAGDVRPGERITVRVHDGGMTRRSRGRGKNNDTGGGTGRRCQQEPLARDPQRRVPRARHRG